MKRDLSALALYQFEASLAGGRWIIPRHGVTFSVVASWGDGWDHVSVSTPRRCPSYDEMEWVRELFFDAAETVMQLSVPRSEHINCHPYCLHLWRPQDEPIPQPPAWMV